MSDAMSDNGTATPRPRLALVVPIFNDHEPFECLCREIDALAAGWPVELSLIAVDDASLRPWLGFPAGARPTNIAHVRVVTLTCNLGHQRAIAIGLVEAASDPGFDAVLVADGDGEDRPADFARLIAAHRARPDAIIVARRGRRSEGKRFSAFYALYKAAFATLTGQRIDFGNFVLLPRQWLVRLVNMPELWNHVAASLLRSRIPLHAVECARGSRYAGQSAMGGVVGLIVHGLSAIAVFSDRVFARLLIVSAAITALAILMGTAAIVIRLTTDLAIPGWTTTVVGVSLVILSEALLFSMVASLTMLRDRSAAVIVPSAHAEMFVGTRVTLFDDRPGRGAAPGSGAANDA